jgi:methylmalonyl-CoA/ethylmalonyl-CoA epimerase
MDKYGLKFHHLGLATKKCDKAVKLLKGLGYSISESVFDSIQNVNLIMCTNPSMPDIEIIYPAQTSGHLDILLKEHSEQLYHICYTSGNLSDSLEKIKTENRLITVSERKPAILFSNKFVSFYLVAGFGIIEILEE